MAPIALCSVISIAFVVERSIRLREGELGSKRYGSRILQSLESGGPEEALEACDRDPKPLGRVLRAGIARFSSPVLELEKAVEDAGSREVKRLNANLKPLIVVALIAPLLGLLGTVLGMISAFQALQAAGSRADPALLAGGIWEALLTTAAGMAVAIPASAALTWFEAVIDRIRRDVEDAATRLFVAPLQENPLPMAAE